MNVWIEKLILVSALLGALSASNADEPAPIAPPGEVGKVEAVAGVPAKGPLKLTLREAANLALEHSESVMSAEEKVKAAQSAETRAWSHFFPTIDIEANVGTYHDRQPLPGDIQIPLVPRLRNSYIGQLVLRQNLFAGFRDVSVLAKMRDALSVAKMALLSERDNTVMNVIDTYYAIQLAQQSIEAEQETASLRVNQLKEIENRLHAGRATEFDRLQASYAVKGQGPRIESLRAELETKTLRLARLLGMSLDEEFELTDMLDHADVIVAEAALPKLSDAFKTALERNPDLVKVEAEFSRVRNENREEAAKHLPTADLQVTGGTNSYLRDDVVSKDSLTYGAQLIVKIPIFSGLESFAEHSEKGAKLRALMHDRARQRERILEDLTTAYRAWTLSKATIEAQRANVALAQETVKRGRALYQAGRATLSEVLDSLTRYLDAKKQLGQAHHDKLLALAAIKTYLGIGYAR